MPLKRRKIVKKLGSFLNAINPLGRRDGETDTNSTKPVVRQLTHQGLTWIDIINPTRKELSELGDQYGFEPLHLEACLSRGQLDRMEAEDKYLFLLLHAPKSNKKQKKISTTRICFLVGKKYLITIHKGLHQPFADEFSQVAADPEKQTEFFKKNSGYLLYQLLKLLADDMAILHDTILKEVDEIEDLVFDVNTSGAYEITLMRQKIVRLKRVTSPFKSILQELATNSSEIASSQSRFFKYLMNDVNKLRELLEEAKEVIEIYKDADFTVSTERTNKILGILTIIFTLGIPATIVGSFYGMNVLIPGGIEAGSWMFLGPYTTFYFVVAAAVIPALLMLWYFKAKKWF